MKSRPRKLVVAGLVTGGDQMVLITQRTAAQAFPLVWEFPGGKVEDGESPVAALVRELREEIGVSVEVGQIWDVLFHRYPDFDVLMLVYHVRIVAGVPTPIEVAALQWLPAAELGQWDFIEADAPLVRRLTTNGVPAFQLQS